METKTKKLEVDRRSQVIESHGRLNDVGRIMRRLGFLPTAERGLSPRSTTFRGFFSIVDRRGNEWHVVG